MVGLLADQCVISLRLRKQMKRFLLRCLILGSIVAAIGGGVAIWAWRTEMAFLRCALRSPETQIAAVGDSHVEVSLDPSVLPKFQNFGRSASPLIVSLIKARIICEENPQLKVLIVGVWPIRFFDFALEDTGYYAKMCYPMYVISELYPTEHRAPVAPGFLKRFTDGIVLPAIRHTISPESDCFLAGSFVRRDTAFLETKWNDISLYQNQNQQPVDAQREGYGEKVLKQFLTEMHASSVKVVLVTAPVHPWTRMYSIPQEDQRLFIDRMTRISRLFQVPWFNFWEEASLQDLQWWADCDHLNGAGAVRYSQLVYARLSVQFPELMQKIESQ